MPTNLVGEESRKFDSAFSRKLSVDAIDPGESSGDVWLIVIESTSVALAILG